MQYAASSQCYAGRITLAPQVQAFSVADMAKKDPEGAFIGRALQALEAEAGMSRRELVEKLGISYSHFSNLVADIRPAGMPTIRRIAERSGRAMAFFFGDVQAATPIGTLTPSGAVQMMVDSPALPALIRVEATAGPFKPGDVLHITPGPWTEGRWGLFKERDEYVIGWMHSARNVQVYTGFDGKTVLVDPDRVVGVVSTITTSAPPPPAGFLR